MSDYDSLFADDEILDPDDIDSWTPIAKGETLIGKILQVGQVQSSYANQAGEKALVPKWVLQAAEDKIVTVIGYRKTLGDKMLEAEPIKGQLARIVFQGSKLGNSGNKYYLYDVLVKDDPKTLVSVEATTPGVDAPPWAQ